MEKHYNIQDRAFTFGLEILKLADQMPCTKSSRIFTDQLIRSGVSVGANLEEASAASSKIDFAYRVGISLREARETNYWLRLINESKILQTGQLDSLISESIELKNILGAIISNAKGKRKKTKLSFIILAFLILNLSFTYARRRNTR